MSMVCTGACRRSMHGCVSLVCMGAYVPRYPQVFCIVAETHRWSLLWLHCLVVTWLLFRFISHGVFVAVADVYVAVQGVAVLLLVHRARVLVAPIFTGIISVMIIAFIIIVIISYCCHY